MTEQHDPPEFTATFLADAYNCESHRYADCLPCPWPGCANGVVGEELTEVVPGTQIRQRFVRRKYASLSGDDRFLWMGDVGATFTADRRADVEIGRANLRPGARTISTIYHYTDATAFLSILKTQELWLTDYSYLNDYKEVSHGIELARQAIGKACARATDAADLAALSALRSNLQDLSHMRICMCCFSEDGDSLPQWRAYGALAVGMNVGRFVRRYAPDCLLDRVSYDEGTQMGSLEVIIHEHLQAMHLDATFGKSCRPDLVASILAGRLVRRIAFFKNPSFKEEREVRYCLLQDARSRAHFGVPLVESRYRSKHNLVVPFVGTDDLVLKHNLIAGATQLPLVEVVIGPQANSDLVESGVREALKTYGYPEAVVRQSSIPFRAIG